MSKRLISLLLVLVLAVSIVAVGSVSASAAGATITVGGKNYTANVGDIVTYKLSFTYPAAKIATAQAELPMDFSVLEGPSQDDLDSIFEANDDIGAFRYDTANARGLIGYVVNYVSFTGMDCSSATDVMTLQFKVLKAGSVTLKAGLRDVSDVQDHDIVDNKGKLLDTGFTYTESLTVSSSKVTISGSVISGLNADPVTIRLTPTNSDDTLFTATVNTLNGTYSFSVDPFSSYRIFMTKKNHVERTYTVSVNDADVTENLRICPIGDFDNNCKVNIRDVNSAYNHVMETNVVTDPYKIKCGDVAKPFAGTSINIRDVNALYNHVMEVTLLYS